MSTFNKNRQKKIGINFQNHRFSSDLLPANAVAIPNAYTHQRPFQNVLNKNSSLPAMTRHPFERLYSEKMDIDNKGNRNSSNWGSCNSYSNSKDMKMVLNPQRCKSNSFEFSSLHSHHPLPEKIFTMTQSETYYPSNTGNYKKNLELIHLKGAVSKQNASSRHLRSKSDDAFVCSNINNDYRRNSFNKKNLSFKRYISALEERNRSLENELLDIRSELRQLNLEGCDISNSIIRTNNKDHGNNLQKYPVQNNRSASNMMNYNHFCTKSNKNKDNFGKKVYIPGQYVDPYIVLPKGTIRSHSVDKNDFSAFNNQRKTYLVNTMSRLCHINDVQSHLFTERIIDKNNLYKNMNNMMIKYHPRANRKQNSRNNFNNCNHKIDCSDIRHQFLSNSSYKNLIYDDYDDIDHHKRDQSLIRKNKMFNKLSNSGMNINNNITDGNKALRIRNSAEQSLAEPNASTIPVATFFENKQNLDNNDTIKTSLSDVLVGINGHNNDINDENREEKRQEKAALYKENNYENVGVEANNSKMKISAQNILKDNLIPRNSCDGTSIIGQDGENIKVDVFRNREKEYWMHADNILSELELAMQRDLHQMELKSCEPK